MVADEPSGLISAVDALNGQILTVIPDGTITLAADFSEGHPVLTGNVVEPKRNQHNVRSQGSLVICLPRSEPAWFKCCTAPEVSITASASTECLAPED
jgi:hypothetical protein